MDTEFPINISNIKEEILNNKIYYTLKINNEIYFYSSAEDASS